MIPWTFMILIYLQKPSNKKSGTCVWDTCIRIVEFLTVACSSGMTAFSMIQFPATLSVGYVFLSNFVIMAVFMITYIKYPIMIQEVPRKYLIMAFLGCLSIITLYAYLVTHIPQPIIQPSTRDEAFLSSNKIITETPMSEILLDEYHPASGHFDLPMNQSSRLSQGASVLIGGRELYYIEKIEAHYKVKLGKQM